MAAEAKHDLTPEEREKFRAAIKEGMRPVEMPDFAGRLIGNGGNRAAYEHTGNPDLVVKVAHMMPAAGANIDEWYNFVMLQQFGMSQWVAPCHEIAQDGAWLIMERTEPLTEPVELDIPIFLDRDTKLPNWGRLRGRIVCHDYQTIGGTGIIRSMLQRTTRAQLYRG